MPNKESYLAHRVEHVDLGLLGEAMEGFYVDLEKPFLMARAKYERVWGKIGEAPSGEIDLGKVITSRLSAHIKEWNLIGYDGDTLPIPQSGDAEEILGKIPFQVIEFLARRVMELHNDGVTQVDLALRRGSSSSKEDGEGPPTSTTTPTSQTPLDQE